MSTPRSRRAGWRGSRAGVAPERGVSPVLQRGDAVEDPTVLGDDVTGARIVADLVERSRRAGSRSRGAPRPLRTPLAARRRRCPRASAPCPSGRRAPCTPAGARPGRRESARQSTSSAWPATPTERCELVHEPAGHARAEELRRLARPCQLAAARGRSRPPRPRRARVPRSSAALDDRPEPAGTVDESTIVDPDRRPAAVGQRPHDPGGEAAPVGLDRRGLVVPVGGDVDHAVGVEAAHRALAPSPRGRTATTHSRSIASGSARPSL